MSRVLLMEISRRDRRPWHRYTLRDWFLLTAAYALWLAVVPGMFQALDRMRDANRREQCSNGLRQLGLMLREYEAAQAVAATTAADE